MEENKVVEAVATEAKPVENAAEPKDFEKKKKSSDSLNDEL